MIEILPTLLTPAMLALSPPQSPAPESRYDWQSQTASLYDSTGKAADVNNATVRGSNSYVGNNLTIDDWNSD